MPRDVQGLIDRILASDRMRASSHFSERVYADEPIFTTGRKMAGYLPERYREMRAISRWEVRPHEGGDGLARGRWLSEAELFWRQGAFMADWEDDCPYHGRFKSNCPTYNAMSDRQLRGYFTWRAAVRRGRVEETSAAFAYVYIYELLNGIGVETPEQGFDQLREFWGAYRASAPELDRHMRTWMQDYAVYHGLDAALLAESPAIRHDHALLALRHALADGDDEALFDALGALSSYRIKQSPLAREHGDDTAAICCAVFRRLMAHYDKHRKIGLVESLFGKMVELPYTMFAAAVLFEPERHADCEYEVDGLRRFRCRNGLWTCERVHGGGGRSDELGRIMRTVDARLREAIAFEEPLEQDGKLPKYLIGIINREIATRLAWSATHRPVRIDIDLSKLGGIRDTAAELREALLVDEEREDGPGGGDSRTEPDASLADGPINELGGKVCDANPASNSSAIRTDRTDEGKRRAESAACQAASSSSPDRGGARDANPASTQPESPLSPAQAAYLRALLTDDPAARASALEQDRISEDLLVDAINETLFDVIGDTVIEHDGERFSLIDDYHPDVEGLLA